MVSQAVPSFARLPLTNQPISDVNCKSSFIWPPRLSCHPRHTSFATLQLVELKNGETYNGHLVACDNLMNIHLREVTLTSRVRRSMGLG